MSVRRRFEVARCLGRGGYGEVYQATMYSVGGLASEVALKVLRPDKVVPQGAERLKDEARLLARIRHPVIVRMLDLVVLEGRLAMVTELVEGQDLGHCLCCTPRLTRPALFDVMGAVAGALHEAWSLKDGEDGRPLRMVHRDVKPSNIRVGRFGEVKLLDFGIALAALVDREAQTSSQVVVGSLPYMAPNRYLGEPADHASDMYALACCLFEGLAGRRFLEDVSAPVLLRLAADPQRFRAFRDARFEILPADLPKEVRDLLAALLDPEAERRPNGREVQGAFESFAEAPAHHRLPAWARAHPPADEGGVAGALEGAVLVEDPPDAEEGSEAFSPLPVARRVRRTSVQLDPRASITLTGQRTPYRPWRWKWLAGGVSMAVLLALVFAAVWVWWLLL